MSTPRPWLGSALFALTGSLLEAGVGPFLLTNGFERGDDLPGGVLPVLGAVIALGGLALLLDTYVRLAREGRGTPSPLSPTRELVAVGAYRVVRHPMYLATTLVIVGEALLLRRAILLAGAALYLGAMALLSRLHEEPRLHARYGAGYDAYRQEVPGWIPGRRRP